MSWVCRRCSQRKPRGELQYGDVECFPLCVGCGMVRTAAIGRLYAVKDLVLGPSPESRRRSTVKNREWIGRQIDEGRL